ncbi:MAG: orotate phosphoribosyltransferase [Nanoarchaeota archaeon]
MTEQKREQEIARILLEKQAVIINQKNPFTYASGIKSPIYCDNRTLFSFPDARDKIIDAMLHIIAQEVQNFDVIAGVATAGIPWASIIADRLEKPLIYIRAKPKEHGRENLIEGKVEKGQRVLIIEDLVSTGESSLKAGEAVKETGARVEHCIAVFSYEMKKAEDGFANAQCTLHTTTKFSQLVREAKIMKRISEQEEKIVLEWNQDPENWGKKYGFE